MTDLPRSQALVRQDGPGHILPIEPLTPPGSTTWRIVHFPLILVAVALGLLAIAEAATVLLAHGLQSAGAVPGARFVAAVLSAAAVIVVYAVFVRLVERRRDMAELGVPGALKEWGFGFVGGLLLSSVIFAAIVLLGGYVIVGYGPLRILALPLVAAIAAGVVQEIILRGLFFRLVERLFGSWITLVLSAALFGAIHLLSSPDATLPDGLAIVLEAALVPAAVYMVTRRLWVAIGLHAAWDFAQGALFGRAIGSSAPVGLVETQAIGPDWLTGGAFGSGASLPALVVMTLVFVGLIAIAVRRGRIVRPAWRRRMV